MLVKKSQFDSLKTMYDALECDKQITEELNEELTTSLSTSQYQIENLKEENEALKQEVEDLKANLINKEAERSKVVLTVSDDVEEITPITQVSDGIIDKMIEKKYLPSNMKNDNFSVNLALMVIASEAIERIIEAYDQDLEDDNYDLDGFGKGDE